MDDEFDLDNLLEESVDLQRKARLDQQSRAAAKKGRPQEQKKDPAAWMSRDEWAAHSELVQKMKAKAEGWTKISGVLLMHVQICSNCGSEHSHVEGVFLKRIHAQMRGTSLARPDGMMDIAGLPKEVEIRTQPTTICSECCDNQGWLEATRSIT